MAISLARWRRTRSDGWSAQWMSSRITTRPLGSAAPSTAWATSSTTSKRSSGASAPRASMASLSSPSERSTWRHGRKGGAPSTSRQVPHATAAPPARPAPASSCASRVLPMPGSPTQRTRRPDPPQARPIKVRSESSSRRRPRIPSRTGCADARGGGVLQTMPATALAPAVRLLAVVGLLLGAELALHGALRHGRRGYPPGPPTSQR